MVNEFEALRTGDKDFAYEKDGLSYQDAEGVIMSGFFGFCACGMPEQTLSLVLAGLRHMKEKRPSDPHNKTWFPDWTKRGNEIFGNEASRYFFYYWLDKEGFTEHGGSVPGWLTSKGEELMAWLESWEIESKAVAK